jgi:purine-nucleoside phosphorylase
MLGFTGTFKGKPISVQAVRMGCGAAIYYSELIRWVPRIIRVGTAEVSPMDCGWPTRCGHQRHADDVVGLL